MDVDVENTGKMDGDEVVQVYVKNEHPDAPSNPVLCGFKRVTLRAGERRRLSLPLDERAFTVVNQAGERILNHGAKVL